MKKQSIFTKIKNILLDRYTYYALIGIFVLAIASQNSDDDEFHEVQTEPDCEFSFLAEEQGSKVDDVEFDQEEKEFYVYLKGDLTTYVFDENCDSLREERE